MLRGVIIPKHILGPMATDQLLFKRTNFDLNLPNYTVYKEIATTRTNRGSCLILRAVIKVHPSCPPLNHSNEDGFQRGVRTGAVFVD